MGANDGRDPLEDYRIINKELEQYELRLMERPQIVLANKMDLEGAEDNLKRFKEAYPQVPVYPVITLIAEGLDEVLYKVADLLETTPEFPMTGETETEEGVLYKFVPKAPDFTVTNLGNHQWRLEGPKVEKLFKMTDFEVESQVYRFAQSLRKLGVDEALRQKGAEDGDLVFIQDYQFAFVE